MKKSKKLTKLVCVLIFAVMLVGMAVFAFDLNVVYASTSETIDVDWGLCNAQVFEAQQITKGSNTVLVGVIDSGMARSHPALQDSLDQTGLHRNFYDKNNSSLVDANGHGTQVAGIIASQFDNRIGMGVGVAPNVKLVSLKALNNGGKMDENQRLIDAINYATKNKILILNYSGITRDESIEGYLPDLKQAIMDYNNVGGLLVCAAGNQGKDINGNEANIEEVTEEIYPAALDLPNIITVGAISSDNQIATKDDWGDGSNFGKTSVDLFAPGTDIYTTSNNGGYEYVSGTSFAAPYVTGVAALLKSINPKLEGTEIKEIILNNVDEVVIDEKNVLETLCASGGKLNAFKAVSSVAYDFDETTGTITGLNFVPNGELTLPTTIKINDDDYLVENIGNNAFENCTSLTEISLPAGITSIGDSVFRGCSSLTNISMSSNITSIGDDAFAYCSGLTSITIPNGVTEIGDNVFEHCSQLMSVTIPKTITSIGKSAFAYCTNLASVTLENDSQLTQIGNNAFENCTSLTGINLPIGITSIGDSVFANCINLSQITIPANVESVESYAFQGCTKLREVIFANDSQMKYIRTGAFQRCDSLREITIPNGVTTIDNYAFQMSGLTKVNVNLESNLTAIGEGAFNQTGIEYIVIPSGVVTMGSYVFSACESFEVVYYAGSEADWNNISIGTNNTYLTNAQKYYYSEEEPAGYGYFWHYADDELQVWPFAMLNYTLINNDNEYEVSQGSVIIGNVEIPSTVNGLPVTSIGNSAFYGCYQLTGIVIPSSVTRIGDYAFAGCEQLTNCTFEEDSSLEYVGYEAFSGCYALGEITLPSSVRYVGALAFANWGENQRIRVEAELANLEQWDVDWATQSNAQIEWNGYNQMATQGLEYERVEGGYEVLVGDSLLTGNGIVVIPAEYEGYAVIGIATNGFAQCTDLLKVIIVGNNLCYVGEGAFSGCNHLTGINLPEGLIEIGNDAFSGCEQLENVILPQSVGLIGPGAFCSCSSLKSITIPRGVVYMSEDTLDGIIGYTIYTELSAAEVGDWAFLSYNPECVIYYDSTLAEEGYVVSILSQGENYVNGKPSAPYRDGYIFMGWSTVEGGEVEFSMQEVIDGAIDGTVLYAVWQENPSTNG